ANSNADLSGPDHPRPGRPNRRARIAPNGVIAIKHDGRAVVLIGMDGDDLNDHVLEGECRHVCLEYLACGDGQVSVAAPRVEGLNAIVATKVNRRTRGKGPR